MKSSLIIHSMMKPCQLRVKQGQKILKICAHTNFGSGNLNITFILNIDELFIIYSLNNDTMSFVRQARSKNSKNWYTY